jgi:hypothetical protein
MTVPPIPAKVAERLAQLCGMFGSSAAGERANAAALADRLVRQSGLSWHDVIRQPSPHWHSIAWHLRAHRHMLNAREFNFIDNITRSHRPPTDKQLAWLEAIYSRLQREAA